MRSLKYKQPRYPALLKKKKSILSNLGLNINQALTEIQMIHYILQKLLKIYFKQIEQFRSFVWDFKMGRTQYHLHFCVKSCSFISFEKPFPINFFIYLSPLISTYFDYT